MEFLSTPLQGLLVIKPTSFDDERGSFMESFNLKKWKDSGLPPDFVQDNQSVSKQGVIRGLHFQRHPHEQGKLVRVIHGKALDVVVDIRPESETFGRHFSIVLDPIDNLQLWIPPGFAHGFESLAEGTVFLYKVTGYYNAAAEAGIRFDDPELAIGWRGNTPIVSAKDKLLPTLKEWMASH